jgi:hypothetical protein
MLTNDRLNPIYRYSALLLLGLGSMACPNIDITNTPGKYVDISAGQGIGSGLNPSAVIDPINSKLLVVTTNLANGSRLGLFRCNLDGTECQYINIAAGMAPDTGINPSAVIDVVNQKLLIAFTNEFYESRLGVFVCNLDGAACVYVDISMERPFSGLTPSVVIDKQTMFVATNDIDSKIGFTSCPLYRLYDLRNINAIRNYCLHLDDISGAGYAAPSAVLDSDSDSYFNVVATNIANGRLSFIRCDLNKYICSARDLSSMAGVGGDTGLSPSAVIDTVHHTLHIATTNHGDYDTPGFFYCSLEPYFRLGPTKCSYRSISGGQGEGSGKYPSTVLVYPKLYVATGDAFYDNRVGVSTCNADGTSCTAGTIITSNSAIIGGGSEPNSGLSPSAAYDPVNKRMLYVTDNGANGNRLALFY